MEIIETIIGFRFIATGVFGYSFLYDKEEICTISSVVCPFPPVMIRGYGDKWISEAPECAVIPGTKRSICDYETNNRIAEVEFKNCDNSMINNLFSVCSVLHKYVFYYEGGLIAEVKRIEDSPIWWPTDTYYDYETYYEVNLYQHLSNETKMLIMAYPMIRLYQ